MTVLINIFDTWKEKLEINIEFKKHNFKLMMYKTELFLRGPEFDGV